MSTVVTVCRPHRAYTQEDWGKQSGDSYAVFLVVLLDSVTLETLNTSSLLNDYVSENEH